MKTLIFLLLLSLSTGSYGSQLILARDLQADGIHSNAHTKPVIILYTASYCVYCEAVKEEFFNHIADDPEYLSRIILREIVIDDDTALLDFAGTSTSHRKYANQREISLVPTVGFYDARGNALTDPLIGVRLMDFYLWYLQQGIKAAERSFAEQNG